MDWLSILIATAAVGCIGLIIGLLLGLAAKKLEVKEDEKVSQILTLLPGNNCGGCGFAGCADLAKAIAQGEASAAACPVGGAAVSEEIGKVLGEEVSFVKKAAFVACSGNCNITDKKYDYYGEKNCELMDYVPGKGEKRCQSGCLGYGSCVKVCTYDAIRIVDGVAEVSPEKCTACGKCAAVCPKHLIRIIPAGTKVLLACSSHDIGKNIIKACEKGCIGCKKCERTCPKKAITVKNNLPEIDYSLCVGCGLCVKDCPRGVLIRK